MTQYTEKDLVSFGNYLLSEERTKSFKAKSPDQPRLPLKDRLRCVTDADLQNWKHEKS